MAEVDWTTLPGRLVVLSGASGSGKSTLVERLLEKVGPAVQRSISATTRPPRPGEVHGRDYFFVSLEEFERLRGDLLESALVHGSHYGTPADPVRQALARGICIVLVIDVQGGLQIREKVPNALLIFVQTPSPEVLERRLRARGTDDEATITRRLTNARREIETAQRYEIHLVNDDLETCVDELAATLSQNRCGGGNAHD
ncbi:MAG: guanylate kinase [Paludisphaera borealis]|uniref:guanylate kinase n=1 Tax=Paludisphaera borealis TaxID=1387353 RepID=UPI00284D3D82|nr:guanylate kinase [Paludisphaera borealis]MDR3618064.1 guanylate kinase [Paludisphaera borealis]